MRRILLAALFWSVSCAHVAPAPRPDAFEAVTRAMPAALRDTGTPGAVVAVVRDGQVVYLRAFGVSNVESGTELRPDAVFRIASLTKSFTGLTAAALQERGAVDLAAPIGQYTPGLPPRLSALTLAQLLSHTAGVRDEAAGYGPRDPSALAAAARRLTDADLFTTPGDVYSYSNLGFTLAGYAIESAAKEPFAAVVERELLRPLGMSRSTFDAATAMTYPLAIGHRRRGAAGGGAAVLGQRGGAGARRDVLDRQ
jgi:CubicO group peptidase (beta-lactamase class C family)